jgi:hypothetical protein
MSTIRIGQVYASTHSGDVAYGRRQRREVVDIALGADSFVWLRTLDDHRQGHAKSTRVRLRSPRAHTIPGHRLVEDNRA